MTIKLWSVYAGELDFIRLHDKRHAPHIPVPSTMIGFIADDCWNTQAPLVSLTYEFHHDHRSDGNTYIILLTLIVQFLDYLSNHSLTLIATVICCDINVSNMLSSLLQEGLRTVSLHRQLHLPECHAHAATLPVGKQVLHQHHRQRIRTSCSLKLLDLPLLNSDGHTKRSYKICKAVSCDKL